MANWGFELEMPKDKFSGRHKMAIDPSNDLLSKKHKDTLFSSFFKTEEMKVPFVL